MFEKIDNEGLAEKVLGLTPDDGINYDNIVNHGYDFDLYRNGDIFNGFNVYKTKDPQKAVKMYIHDILNFGQIKEINSYNNWDYALVLFDDYGIMPLKWDKLKKDYDIDDNMSVEEYYKKLQGVPLTDFEKYIDYTKSLDSDYEKIYQYDDCILINDDNFR